MVDSPRSDFRHGLLGDCFALSKKTLGYEVNFDFNVVFSEIFRAADGFDVVIANPPYIDSEAMTKADAPLRKLIQSSYTMTRGNWDIYIAFYERGFRLLGSGAGLSFITPDKWISKPFGDEMRINTTPNIFSILKAGREVFETVNVDAIVSVFTKSPQPWIVATELPTNGMGRVRTMQDTNKLLAALKPFKSSIPTTGRRAGI